MEINLNNFHLLIKCGWYYLKLAVAIAILFRVIISILKVVEYSYMPSENINQKIKYFNGLEKFKRFRLIFWGFNRRDPYPDFWYNTFLGVLELLVFPILMKANEYGMVGAWIGFKSVAQWNAWNKNRYVFNRFLIAHALMIIICFWYLTKYIS